MTFTQPLHATQEIESDSTAVPATDKTDAVPKTILGYELQSRLGSGGYGEVWRAIGPGGLPKAVKILFGRRDGQQADVELKALNRMRDLRHPFLLNIERIEVFEERLVVVTELADGNLQERYLQYRENGLQGIPRDELLTYIRDAADALDFMYQQHGLQHLDIKPDNLLIQGGHVKVGDFGLAKDISMTHISVVNGFTPLYAPPEIFEGRPGKTSDQYSLAIVYQMMLTGIPPFKGRTAAQLTAQHLRSQPDLTALPTSDRPAMARALSKNVHSRFDDCRQFVEDLTRRTTGRSVHSAPSNQNTPDDNSTHFVDTADVVRSDNEESLPVPVACATSDGSKLRPALFIGIGGLAEQMLSEIKSGIDSTASDDQPQTTFLHIDSHRESNPFTRTNVAQSTLNELERVLIPLRSSKEYRSDDALDLSWISRRWLFNIPRSGQVEGIRPLGRLALSDHQSQVMARLGESIEQAASSQGELDIYVIAATNGGTGSGCVVDVAFMIREILAKQTDTDGQLFGVLLHGTSGSGSVADVQDANTTSCLQELRLMNVPGLELPRGFQKRASQDEACPFDETYFFHLGNGLNEAAFANRTSEVATLLQSATTAAAALDFRTWRGSYKEDSDGHGPLRLLGFSSLDSELLDIATKESTALCTSLLQKCLQPGSGTNVQMAITASKEEAQELLQSRMLTDSALSKRVMTLLKGNTGQSIDRFSEYIFSCLKSQQDLTTKSRNDVVTILSQTIELSEEALAGSPLSLTSIVESVRAELDDSTRQTVCDIQTLVTRLLDSPHHLDAAISAVNTLAGDLQATQTGANGLVNEIEHAYTETCKDSGDQISADNLQAFCRQYCTLVAYQTIYRCFLQHIENVQSAVSQLDQQLSTVRKQLATIITNTSQTDQPARPVPDPIVDEFDGYLRSQKQFLLSALLKNNGNSNQAIDSLTDAAIGFLMKSGEKASHNDENTHPQSNFPTDAWPVLRMCGGRRRVLAMLPANTDTAQWSARLKKTFGECVAVRQHDSNQISVVCEIEGVSIDRVIKRLTSDNPRVADIASRVHTRIDIDW